jgi:hypothetical protein
MKEEPDYYRVRNKKIYLERSAQQMVVKFNEDTADNLRALADRSAEQKAALQSILQVPSSEISVSMDRQLSREIFIVKASPKEGSPLERSRIKAFSALPGVAYAYPLYYSIQGSHAMVLTDEILVRFSSGFTEKDIRDFCRQNGLAHVRKSKSGLKVHVLRLIDPKARSPLEVVNAIDGSGGVLWVEPNFLSEVKFQNSQPSRGDRLQLQNTGNGSETSE